MPGVRTSVINSYLSNTGGQNIPSLTNPNALMATLDANTNLVEGNSQSNAVSATSIRNTNALVDQSNQDPTVVSPKIFSVIKNSIVQALNNQITNTQAAGPSSNVNALLLSQNSTGSMVDAAGAQINSFVNSLIFTVQSQTNLAPQNGIPASNQLSHSSTLSQIPVASGLTNQAPNTTYQVVSSQGMLESAIPVASPGNNATPAVDVSTANQSLDNTSSTQQEVAQNLSNVHGWVVGRIYSSMQSMIEMLAVTQSSNAGGSGISTPTASLDSLIQSANSLFASLGLTSTVTASTLQTALQDIQRNLMSAPAQGQWINVVA